MSLHKILIFSSIFLIGCVFSACGSSSNEEKKANSTKVQKKTKKQTAKQNEKTDKGKPKRFTPAYYKSAIQNAEKALRKNPKNVKAYNSLCVAHLKLKNFDKALDACQKGLKINPNAEVLKRNLKRVELALERKGANKK